MKTALKATRRRLTICKRMAATVWSTALRKSDYKTWGKAENLRPDWDERTLLLARLIPENSSVIEFGAARLTMKELIPSSCSYTPSDLVDRGEGTIVLDLNAAQLVNLGKFDVAVFGGVLEYVFDVPRAARFAADICTVVIFSYVIGGKNVDNGYRLVHGWVNNYTAVEIEQVFKDAGFVAEQKQFYRQHGDENSPEQVILRMRKS